MSERLVTVKARYEHDIRQSKWTWSVWGDVVGLGHRCLAHGQTSSWVVAMWRARHAARKGYS